MGKSVVFVADNVRSLENVGSIFRTADGLGASEVICVGISSYPDRGELDTRRPWLRLKNHKAIAKTALSGIEMPFRYFATPLETVEYLRSGGYFVVCVEQSEKSVDLGSSYTLQAPLAIVIGHELDGVSREFLDAADLVVEIPMQGKGISFNVSVSAGIAGYVLTQKL
jgi:tRNA G18 (ribose-2'-O)-methylase SpoU